MLFSSKNFLLKTTKFQFQSFLYFFSFATANRLRSGTQTAVRKLFSLTKPSNTSTLTEVKRRCLLTELFKMSTRQVFGPCCFLTDRKKSILIFSRYGMVYKIDSSHVVVVDQFFKLILTFKCNF